MLEILAKQWGPLQRCWSAVNKNEFGARRDQDVASVWEGCRVVPQVEVVQVLTVAEVIQIGDMGFPRFVNLCYHIDISGSALHITVKLTTTHYIEHCGLAECLQRHVLMPPLPQETTHMQFELYFKQTRRTPEARPCTYSVLASVFFFI